MIYQDSWPLAPSALKESSKFGILHVKISKKSKKQIRFFQLLKTIILSLQEHPHVLSDYKLP